MPYLKCKKDGINSYQSLLAEYNPETWGNEVTLITKGLVKGKWICDACNKELQCGDVAYLTESGFGEIDPISQLANEYFLPGTTSYLVISHYADPVFKKIKVEPNNGFDFDLMNAIERLDLVLKNYPESPDEIEERKDALISVKELLESQPYFVFKHIRKTFGVFSWTGILDSTEPDIKALWEALEISLPQAELFKNAVLNDENLASKLDDYVIFNERGVKDPLARLGEDYPRSPSDCGTKYVESIFNWQA